MIKICWYRDKNFPTVLFGSRSMAKRLFVYGVLLKIDLSVGNTTVMTANKRYYVINYCCRVGLLPAAAVGLHCLTFKN